MIRTFLSLLSPTIRCYLYGGFSSHPTPEKKLNFSSQRACLLSQNSGFRLQTSIEHNLSHQIKIIVNTIWPIIFNNFHRQYHATWYSSWVYIEFWANFSQHWEHLLGVFIQFFITIEPFSKQKLHLLKLQCRNVENISGSSRKSPCGRYMENSIFKIELIEVEWHKSGYIFLPQKIYTSFQLAPGG